VADLPKFTKSYGEVAQPKRNERWAAATA
jgi:hypothetical protein